MWTRVALVGALVQCWIAAVAAHLTPSHVAGITITPSDDRSNEGYRVTTTLPSGKTATCTFKFQTATLEAVAKEAAAVPKPAPVVSKGVDFEATIARLKGTCTSRRVDYWDYEVCFGGAVRQIHSPDTYVLGTTGFIDGLSLKYKDGLTCDGLPDRPPRKVEVKFACDRNAGGVQIVRVAEVSTCSYNILCASALFCGGGSPDTRFEDLTGQAQFLAQSAPSNADPSAEDWFLELKPLADGRAVCSAYSLEPRALGSKLHFRSFDLSVERSGGDVSAVAAAAVAGGERPYTARHPGRVDCADDEVEHRPSGAAATLRNAAKFTGKLSYLKAYA